MLLPAAYGRRATLICASSQRWRAAAAADTYHARRAEGISRPRRAARSQGAAVGLRVVWRPEGNMTMYKNRWHLFLGSGGRLAALACGASAAHVFFLLAAQ